MQRPTTPTAPETENLAACATAPALPEIPEAVQLRHQALSPFLEQFREWSGQLQDPQAIPHFAEIAGRAMDLGCWERSVLKQACAPERPDSRSFELLAEGLAYQAKCQHVMGLFTYGPMPPPNELPQFLDQLATEVAVGIALAEELQWEVDKRVSKGQLANAKPLTEFRNTIVHCLDELKERVGGSVLEQAEQRAPRFVEVARNPPKLSKARQPQPRILEEEEPEAPTWAAFGPGKPEPAPEPVPEPAPELPPWEVDPVTPAPAELPIAETRTRLRPLLYLLAALAMFYGLVTLPRVDRDRLPVLTLEKFAHLEAVQRIQARPPSLFVTLHPEGWRLLSPAERRDLITQIGRIAEGVGYFGAQVRTEDGPSVGQWLKKTGVQLWAPSAGPT